MNRKLLTLFVLALGFPLASCGDDPEEPPTYLPQTSEDNVIENFQRAYEMRDIEAYARLLAADFQFYFDPLTRNQLGFEYWTRTEDSLTTAALFSSPEVKKIVIELDWPRGSATANFSPPIAPWTKLFLNDVYLDIDIKPEGQEETTFRVENQQQRFYFRRGRTNPPSGPGDTLLYIVEWRDQGIGSSFAGNTRLPAVEPNTWSRTKAIFFHPTPEYSYLPQTSEDNVLENFQRAYQRRDATAYARLLATDFQFYFDPVTRNQLGIEFWTRTEDSRRTEDLFRSSEVTKIVIALDWLRGSAVNAGFSPPREAWTKLFLTDVFLDVDFAPAGQEVTTFRVEDQAHRFFFRLGSTKPPSGPADTLVYIVEWRDQGNGGFSSPALAQSSTTWSGVKTLIVR